MNRLTSSDDHDLPVYEPDEQAVYSIEVCARITGVSTETIVRYREQGFIAPVKQSNDDTLFGDDALRTVRQIEHLRSTCGVNESGLKLILALLDEVESLRSKLQTQR